MPRDYSDQSPTAFQRLPEYKRDDVWIRHFLREARVGHIASARDGQPFINPSTFWFDEENHQIIFHSNVAGRVRSNVEANPRVCFETSELGKMLPSNVALEFSLQFRSVVVFGAVRLISDSEEARRVLYGLIHKYFPTMTAGEEFREITDKELRSTSVYAIQIEEWSGKENWKDRADQSDEWTPLDEKWLRINDPAKSS
jgi:nitroimidazol reductase NimA-like FMN-containing flavoprotein (pyridoxamine 5'-phosphate oxidase superfamily)